MAKFLTPDVWERYKDVKSSKGAHPAPRFGRWSILLSADPVGSSRADNLGVPGRWLVGELEIHCPGKTGRGIRTRIPDPCNDSNGWLSGK